MVWRGVPARFFKWDVTACNFSGGGLSPAVPVVGYQEVTAILTA
jgi:hypothetical protein